MAGWTVPGYTGIRVLGEGEAGRIDEAVHDASGERVAITYLTANLCADEVFRERLRHEAELLADLDHPNVVRVRALVESGTELALVTDAVEGAALRRVLANSGPLSQEAALAVLRASLLALGAADGVGVVHRDYQPSDVLITPDGAVKVEGFGLAVRTEAMMPAAGTPSYMAPELWEGASPQLASDIYAATATFYECLTGHVPYSADSIFELQTMHRAAPIPVADVPTALAPLLAQGMAKTAVERPATAAEFLAELEVAAAVEFGLEWEERGRRELSALVAALPAEDAMAGAATAVLPSVVASGADGTAGVDGADGADGAAGSFAGAGMGRGTKIGIGAAAVAVIGAVVAAMALSPAKHSAAATGPSGEIVSSGSDQTSPTDDGESPGVAGAAPKPGSSSAGSNSSSSAKATSDTSSTPTTATTGPGGAPATTATLVGLPVPTQNSWDPPPTYASTGQPPTSGPGSPTGSSAPPTTPSATITISATATMTKSTYNGPCPPTDPPTGAVTFTVSGLPAGNSVPITFHWHVGGTAGTGGTTGSSSGSGEVDARDGTTTTGFTVTDDQHSQKGLSGTVEVTWSAPGASPGTTTAGQVDITCTPASGASSGGGPTTKG